MFDDIAESLVFILIKHKKVNTVDRDIYIYGLEVILLNGMLMISFLIMSIWFNMLYHFLAFVIFFIPLRIFMGGYHAKRSETCFIMSNVMYLISLVMNKSSESWYHNAVVILLTILMLITMFVWSPVKNRNRPLADYQYKRNKKITFVIVVIDFALLFIFYKFNLSIFSSSIAFILLSGITFFVGKFESKDRNNREEQQMKKIRKIVTGVIILSIVMSNCYIRNVVKTVKEENKKCIVLAEDFNAIKNIIEDKEIEEILNEDDKYIAKVNITEGEIKEIEKDEDIVISEDYILKASSGRKERYQNKVINSNNNQETEWNLKMINVDIEKCEKNKKNIKVAILDSGIDYTSDINVIERANFIPGEENIFTLFEDTTGHGTSIAGILAAKDNGKGITGINPNVEIYSARVLDDNNQAPVSRVVEGIYWAIDRKVNIISISFGTNQNSEVLHKAIKDANEAGILIVAAAGNSGGEVEYPAAYEEVMSVGSVTSEGVLSATSARGEKLDINAPGENVKTTGSFGGELIASGTSISVPHVVGVASLLWEKNVECSKDFVKDLLRASANKNNDKTIKNSGIVDYEYAMSIYGEFKEKYENKENKKIDIKENGSELYTEKEEVVNARWGIGDNEEGHVKIADKVGNQHSLSATKIKILKLGIKYPDQQFPSRYDNPQWHTSALPDNKTDNYISSYRCATLIAKKLKNGNNITTVSKPAGMQADNYTRMLNQVGNISWTTNLLGGASVTNSNKGMFVLGMAMHIITDTYAHQAYVKENGNWNLLKHAEGCDNYSVYGKRYTIATSAAYDALNEYLAGNDGDHWEYVQAYDGTTFRLHKLVQYAQKQDTYSADTFGELATLKKGDVEYAQ